MSFVCLQEAKEREMKNKIKGEICQTRMTLTMTAYMYLPMYLHTFARTIAHALKCKCISPSVFLNSPAIFARFFFF